MNWIAFFTLLIFLTSCPRTATKPTIDCGGCGLKDSGKKYKNIKKQERKKN